MKVLVTIAALAVAVSACDSTSDSDTLGAYEAGGAVAMDSMDHAGMGMMDRSPAQNEDHEFLRMMVDHHEGLVVMMRPAMERAATATARADARKVHDKQKAEQERMLTLARTAYNDGELHPMMMSSNRLMNDSLQAVPPERYDAEMYRQLIAHHREGLEMIDRFLPQLTDPEVRRMAEQMKRDQEREISEFERKVSTLD